MIQPNLAAPLSPRCTTFCSIELTRFARSTSRKTAKAFVGLICVSAVFANWSNDVAGQTQEPQVVSESIASSIHQPIQSNDFDVNLVEVELSDPPPPTLEQLEVQRDYETAKRARVARLNARVVAAQEKLQERSEPKKEEPRIELDPSQIDETNFDEDDEMMDDEMLDDEMMDDEDDSPPQRPAFGPWPRKGIRGISIDIRESSPNAPQDISSQLINSSNMNWTQFQPAPKVYAWAAPDIRYQPLYFEDVALERYGQTAPPYRQSLSSGYHFWKSFWLLPHQMRHDHPGSCDHPLGFCRPGNPTPYTVQRHFFGNPPRR